MTSDKGRLIELLQAMPYLDVLYGTQEEWEGVADYLLANGVIVSMCYIGQPMWYVYKSYNGRVEIRAGKISMIQQKADKSWKFRFSHNSSVWDFKTEDIGVKYFTTKEEAEKALERSKGN